MEWYIMNANGLNGLDVHLGMLVGDTYIVDDDCLETLDLLCHRLHKEDPVNCPVRHYVLTSRLLSLHIRHIVKYCVGSVELISLCVKLMLDLSKPFDAYENVAMTPDAKEVMAQLAAEVRTILRSGMAADLFSEISTFIKQAGQLHVSDPCLELARSALQMIMNTLTTCPESERCTFSSELLLQGLDELLFYSANCSQRIRLIVPAAGIMWFVYSDFEWLGGPVTDEDAPATADDRRKRLIVRMLEQGLGKAVGVLQEIMLEPQFQCKASDEKYYFWLIAYFLRHNQHVGVPLSCLKEILSKQCLGFLVYKSLEYWEQLMIVQTSTCRGALSKQQKQPGIFESNERALLQVRLGLAISALMSVLTVIKEFGETRLDDDSVAYLTNLIGQVVAMEDLREMLLLFVRCYDDKAMPLAFLVAVVRLNHRLLSLAECFMECHGTSQPQFDMMHHIAQFASPRIMQIYSTLARRFSSNDSELNDCVFTMMDHVARDVGRVDTLLQSETISTFMRLNSKNSLPENCDLAEYVLQAFLSQLQNAPGNCMNVCTELLLGKHQASEAAAEEPSEVATGNQDLGSTTSSTPSWSEEERDSLFELYFKIKGEQSVAAVSSNLIEECNRVAEALEQRGYVRRSAPAIIAQLRIDGLLDEDETSDASTGASGQQPEKVVAVAVPADVVAECVSELLLTEDGAELLVWLSEQLSDVACAKQLRERMSSYCDAVPTRRHWPAAFARLGMAAVAYYSVRCNVDTPLITYSEAQEQAVAQRDGTFRRLLVALGFRMPHEGLLFPRMPAAWSAHETLSKSQLVAVSGSKGAQTGLLLHGTVGEVQQAVGRLSADETSEHNSKVTSGDQEYDEEMDVTEKDVSSALKFTANVGPSGEHHHSSRIRHMPETSNVWLMYMQPGGLLK